MLLCGCTFERGAACLTFHRNRLAPRNTRHCEHCMQMAEPKNNNAAERASYLEHVIRKWCARHAAARVSCICDFGICISERQVGALVYVQWLDAGRCSLEPSTWDAKRETWSERTLTASIMFVIIITYMRTPLCGRRCKKWQDAFKSGASSRRLNIFIPSSPSVNLCAREVWSIFQSLML